MTIDVEQARQDTPGCRDVVHLNNAGAALPPAVVTTTMIDYLHLEARMGGYEAAAFADDRIEHTYDAVASLLGCDRTEVAMVENASRAWDMAFYAFPFAAGDRILTGRAEYVSSTIAMRQVAARTGAVVDIVDDDEHGQIDVAELARRMDDDVRLIAVTHAPTHSGLVNPVADVGRIAKDAGVPFLVDACQSVGQMPTDVAALGCDLLAATGRKFLRAPRGTGFLYVAAHLAEQLVPPLLDVRSATLTDDGGFTIRPDARRFETFEAGFAARLGLGAAVDYACALGLDAIEARVTALAATLRDGLAAIPGVVVQDRGLRLGGIVTFTVDGVPADAVQAALHRAGINTNVSLGVLVRASPHYYNTEDELERLLGEVSLLAGR
jgi:cysteine desulfurase/selenocysteine lyase